MPGNLPPLYFVDLTWFLASICSRWLMTERWKRIKCELMLLIALNDATRSLSSSLSIFLDPVALRRRLQINGWGKKKIYTDFQVFDFHSFLFGSKMWLDLLWGGYIELLICCMCSRNTQEIRIIIHWYFWNVCDEWGFPLEIFNVFYFSCKSINSLTY